MNIFLIAALFLFILCSGIFLLVLVFYMLFNFLIPMVFYGAIFAKSKQEIVEKIISLAQIEPGQKAADVGSGDGRLVIAMAKAGLEAHGYEINPFLIWISRKNIKKAGLHNKALVHWKNFWNEDFSQFDVITIYGISYIMGKLETKLKKELKPGARVVSNYFAFPNWPPSRRENNIYLYLQSR